MYKLITPAARADAVSQIDTALLLQKGIKGLILDLDNTIIPWGGGELSQEILIWLEKILNEGFKITILSNSRPKRVAAIAEPLAIPYIANACKPISSGFRKALASMSLKPEETAIIGDQLFTDVFGGNMAGLYTIWIKPISSREFITTKLLNRNLEKIAIRILKSKDLLK